ncbi:MAG: T9SS type A sorting domain-containing protein [Bacteroidia bacterium]|nr:T9SS type A sorting domain-containing protein [Bacteroidia bacterium]
MKIKSFVFILFSFHVAFNCKGQSAGPNSPDSVIEASAGCLSCPGNSWSTPSNAKTEDNKFASVSLSAPGQCFQGSCSSRGLILTNFSFAIPSAAIILGIKAEVKQKADSLNSINDTIVQLTKDAGLSTTANRGSLNFIDSLNKYYSYGGTTDLWSTSWTPAQINSTDFGLILSYNNKSKNGGIANIDHVRISVIYSISSGIAPQTSSISNFTLLQNINENKLQLTFDAVENTSATVYLINMLGEIMQFENFEFLYQGKNELTITSSKIPAGMYILNFNSDNEIHTKRFLKF